MPFLVTLQAYVKVSPEPGSETPPVNGMAVPSTDVAGAPPMLAVGATLVTVMVFVSVPTSRSSSVTWRVTTYEPLSFGVNANAAPLPVVKVTPFFLTVHAYSNVSAEPGSLTELVRAIGVPSGDEVG